MKEAHTLAENMGHWQQGVPKKSGLYWTASRTGEIDRPRVVTYSDDGRLLYAGITGTNVRGEVPAWQGWWWSEPVEEPPKPPEWVGE